MTKWFKDSLPPPRAKLLDYMHRNEEDKVLADNAKAAELIRYSNRRGMSRAAMTRIWGERLVNAVLG